MLCGGQAMTVVTGAASTTRNGGQSATELTAHRLGQDGHGPPESDQLQELLVVADLRPGPVGVAAVRPGPARLGQVRQRAEVGQPQLGLRAEGMSGGQHRDLPFGGQLLGVEADDRVERPVQQRHVGSSVAQHPFLLARARRAAPRPGCAAGSAA